MGSDRTPNLAERLEDIADGGTAASTHSDDCWLYHDFCAIQRGAVAVRERDELAERISVALSHSVTASGGSDRFLIGGEARGLLREAKDALIGRDAK